VFENGRAIGRNTDVHGFVQMVREGGAAVDGAAAVVLGAGGASRAVIAGLLTLGVAEVRLVNRTLDKAETLASRFGGRVKAADWSGLARALNGAGVLVNTTSLGMKGQPPLEIDLGALPAHSTVVDIVYRPLETPLLARAKARGLKAIDGLGMLLHQAQPGFAAWFGVEPKVTPQLRAHLVSLLERG
jgi:shikimate dehydrogenase